MGLWIFLGIIIGIIAYVIITYNSLVTLKEYILNSWSDIEVQLKRRYNLIPTLVDTIKSYKNYEQETLQKIIKARNSFLNSSSMEEKIKASNEINRSLGGIFALAEAYPDLKANENFINLQNTLKETEDVIAQARRYFNASVREYNTKVQTFPSNLIAQKFGFKEVPYFEIDEKETKMPEVKL